MPDLISRKCPSWCAAPHDSGDRLNHWRHVAARDALHVGVVRSDPGPPKVMVQSTKDLDHTLLVEHDQAEALAHVLEELGNADFAELIHLAVRRIEDDEHDEEI